MLPDLQGSTHAVMNNNGSSSTIIARHDYLPFGEEICAGYFGVTSYVTKDLIGGFGTLYAPGKRSDKEAI